MSDILERLRAYIPGENDDFVPVRIKEAADEIARLQKAKREALKIADERTIENVALRSQLEKANACLRQIIEADDEFRMGLPDDWEGDPLSDAVMAAKYLMAQIDVKAEEERDSLQQVFDLQWAGADTCDCYPWPDKCPYCGGQPDALTRGQE